MGVGLNAHNRCGCPSASITSQEAGVLAIAEHMICAGEPTADEVDFEGVFNDMATQSQALTSQSVHMQSKRFLFVSFLSLVFLSFLGR